jgi:hypothetical protein
VQIDGRTHSDAHYAPQHFSKLLKSLIDLNLPRVSSRPTLKSSKSSLKVGIVYCGRILSNQILITVLL